MKKIFMFMCVLALAACGGGDGGSGNGSMYVGRQKYLGTDATNNNANKSSTDNNADDKIDEPTDEVINDLVENIGDTGGITGDLGPDNPMNYSNMFKGVNYVTSNDGSMTFTIENGHVLSIKDNIGTDRETPWYHSKIANAFYHDGGQYEYYVNKTKEELKDWYNDLASEMSPDGYNLLSTSGVFDSLVASNVFDVFVSGGQLTKDQVRTQIANKIKAMFQNLPDNLELSADDKALINTKVNEFVDADIVDRNYTTRVRSIQSYGQGDSVTSKLSFADFGTYANWDYGTENGIKFESKRHGVYVGGIADQEVDVPHIQTTFTGTAVAALNRYDESGKLINSATSVAGGSTLKIQASSSSEVLTMPFSNDKTNPWYDVTVTKPVGNTSLVGKTMAISSGATFDADFRVTNNMRAQANNNHTFETKYYTGLVDNKTIWDATGYVHTDMTTSDKGTLQFDAAFGAGLR